MSATESSLRATVVCSTISKSSEIKCSIMSWVANQPHQIIVVTGPQNHEYMEDLLRPFYGSKVKIIQAHVSNKRIQLCIGFLEASDPIIVIADDDTVWSPHVLSALVAPFEHLPNLGVFPEIQITASGVIRTLWEEIAILRLFGDAIDSRTSQILDGGVFCASGPTAAYRSPILQESHFQNYFRNEKWRTARLNAGDDQSLTRWLCEKNWDVMVLPDNNWGGVYAVPRVDTHSRPTWRHLLQLLRWSRSDWQANIKALLFERSVWR